MLDQRDQDDTRETATADQATRDPSDSREACEARDRRAVCRNDSLDVAFPTETDITEERMLRTFQGMGLKLTRPRRLITEQLVVLAQTAEDEDFTIEGHALAFFGCCPACLTATVPAENATTSQTSHHEREYGSPQASSV